MTGSFKIQLVNMGTRAAAFQAKLRCLHDYHLRLLHNIIPAPSGVDIANNIKYFSQTLLTVLKDVPSSPHEMIKDPSQDHIRMSAYPNLEYGNLYNAVAMLLDVTPNIQFGVQVFGKAVLQVLGCMLPFLDKDLIDNIPYLAASSISVLPPNLHQDIINSLCYYILPFTITRQSVFEDQECHSCQSVSAVIMLVFQYSNNPAHHCQLLECLMTLKQNVVKDLLCVIAYGTAASRSSAAKLLFYYWPAFNANLFDRRGLLCKFTNDLVPFACQRESCPNSGNAEAGKVCYDHNISITFAPDCPPPLYLCIECANEIHREHPNQTFGDILHPMAQVSMVCENKNCRSTDKSAVSICFSTECASYNGNHPIRYCTQCHGNRHNSRRGGDHIVHRSLPPAWQMDAEMQTYMVEAVISLLREAKPLNFEPNKDTITDQKTFLGNGAKDNISLDERQLLGRYGIWLLVGRCTPTQDTPVEILGRLLSMLFHWFHVTAYSFDGQIESSVEKLKTEHVCQWLKDICQTHYKEFIACLLPHPPEYARVGGHWDSLTSRTNHLKEGLQRLICLVPYEIITSEIWDVVMPHWMEAITNDVPEKELVELKIVMSKILDPEMSPLGFDAKTMYNFVTIRFEKTTAKVQQQALHWLQILSKLEILIPLTQLFSMFGDGVRIMKHGVQHEISREKEGKGGKLYMRDRGIEPPKRSSISPVVEDDSGNTSAISDDEGVPLSRHMEFTTDSEHNLTCCILMLDVLLKQMELQDVEQHQGIQTHVCENVSRLLKCMVTAARVGLGSHMCALKVSECAYCEASVMWHQLSVRLVQFMAPENPVRPPDPPIEEIVDDEKLARKSPPDSDKGKDRDVSIYMAPLPIPLGPLGGFGGPVPVAVPQPETHSVGGVLVHMPHVCSISERGRETDIARFIQATDEIMTATVETVSEQLDLAAILPAENIVAAVARSVTLSDTDVATATVHISKPQLTLCDIDTTDSNVESLNEQINGQLDDGEDFWHTSVGKFKFSLESLPQPLQYIHQLLSELQNIEKADILYYMLQCLNVLALHGDALTRAARDQRGFFIWCQENLLIKNFWELCNSEYSHIAEVCVPLLLHCITLPLGSDVFWRIVQEAFHDSDWRVRFQAVERVTVITRFMDSTPLRAEVGLQTALATAFCHLIASMDDISVYVAQRATLYLGTIHDNAITSLLFCLESQFDLFIIDRPVVLQSLYQLHNSLSDRKVITWEFFLNRFDTLFVEAQINLEKSGDLFYLKDLKNSEAGSDILSAKISKAREALSQSDATSTAKTLSASFGTKWPYKRTMSAPASMIPRQDSKIDKEKVYSRQVSAPILKRKSSRFGLGQFLSGSHNTPVTSAPNTIHLHHHHYHYHTHTHPPHLPLNIPTTQSQLNPNFPQSSSAGTTPTTPNLLSAQQYQQQGFCSTSTTTTGIPSTMAADGHLYCTTGDDSNLSACLHRLIDLEESDKETIHLLVFLLMQFMSRADQAYPTEEKPLAKTQNIVLRHLYLLLGYSTIEKGFYITPSRLRSSAVFNVFLANLPQVLDQNPLMGLIILPTTLHVLLYAPNQSNLPSVSNEMTQNIFYTYSLWYLESYVRRNWLMSVLVILYKYQYTQPPYSSQVNNIIRIILNSLDAHFHICKRIPATVILDFLPMSKTKEQPTLTTDQEENSPPFSPLFASEGTSGTSRSKACAMFTGTAKAIPLVKKYQDSSLEADDTESELVAIPESDLSDSTLHGNSAPGSFDDPVHFDDTILPLRTQQNQQKSSMPTTTTSALPQSTFSSLLVTDRFDYSKDGLNSSEFLKSNSQKCSLQEGVRMIVGPSMIMTSDAQFAKQENVITACSPIHVKRAIIVTQANNVDDTIQNTTSLSKSVVSSSESQFSSSPWIEHRALSPQLKAMGHQKRIVEPSITPATTPVSYSESIAKEDVTIGKKAGIFYCRNFRNVKELPPEFGSPESPMSKMNVLVNPSGNDRSPSDSMMSPVSISELEYPMPERLLPIGKYNKDGISALVEKVREALNVPDLSHLKIVRNQDDTLEVTKDPPKSRELSPRRLIKQVALESPPCSQQTCSNNDNIQPNIRIMDKQADVQVQLDQKETFRSQRQRLRKIGPFAVDSQCLPDSRTKYAGSWVPYYNNSDSDDGDTVNEHSSRMPTRISEPQKQSLMRIGDECVCNRCTECGVMLEEYGDEDIGIMVIILGTFIHREPALAAHFLPDILATVTKFAMYCRFPWQYSNLTHLPGGSQSVAHQFIRCVLHQLAPNGMFVQMFLTHAKESHRRKYFRSIAKALVDFNELNPTSPIHMLIESLLSKKALPIDTIPTLLRNMSEYLQAIPMDVGIGPAIWLPVVQGIEILFRRLVLVLPSLGNVSYLLDSMVSVLKIPSVSKGVLDPFSKVLSYSIQNSAVKHKVLVDLCCLSGRAFSKERDRHQLCRQIVFELVQALKFKTNIPGNNLLLLIGIVLQDAGGSLPNGIVDGLPEMAPIYSTNAADCMRQYLNDVVDFLADFHTLSKIKNFKNGSSLIGLGEDTLGGVLKGAIAQYLALEMSRGNSRDNKAVARYLPWLYNVPSSVQQGPKEFTECVSHMRLLAWLLIGALTHMAVANQRNGTIGQHGAAVNYHLQHPGHTIAQPIPQEASCHIADHVQVIFAGFVEQSKTSVLHMSALFHAFTLCQLWTVYLEHLSCVSTPTTEAHNITMGILFEFWTKVTPCILQLVSSSKVLSEMVNLHFLSLMEAFKETRSTILDKLLPIWSPVLSSHSQLTGTLHVRLQSCRDYAPSIIYSEQSSMLALLKWLQRLQFKMGQIELQSSTATQFYSI